MTQNLTNMALHNYDIRMKYVYTQEIWNHGK